jgi:hypothetical protein
MMCGMMGRSLVLLLGAALTTVLTEPISGYPPASSIAQAQSHQLMRLSAERSGRGEEERDERENARRRAQAANGTLQTDRAALLAFRAASEATLPGGGWPASLPGWGPRFGAGADDVCSWGGVACSGGRVTDLRLCLPEDCSSVSDAGAQVQCEHIYGNCTLSQAEVTNIRGNVEGLAPLTALRGMALTSTNVTGDVRAVCSSCGFK